MNTPLTPDILSDALKRDAEAAALGEFIAKSFDWTNPNTGRRVHVELSNDVRDFLEHTIRKRLAREKKKLAIVLDELDRVGDRLAQMCGQH